MKICSTIVWLVRCRYVRMMVHRSYTVVSLLETLTVSFSMLERSSRDCTHRMCSWNVSKECVHRMAITTCAPWTLAVWLFLDCNHWQPIWHSTFASLSLYKVVRLTGKPLYGLFESLNFGIETIDFRLFSNCRSELLTEVFWTDHRKSRTISSRSVEDSSWQLHDSTWSTLSSALFTS